MKIRSFKIEGRTYHPLPLPKPRKGYNTIPAIKVVKFGEKHRALGIRGAYYIKRRDEGIPERYRGKACFIFLKRRPKKVATLFWSDTTKRWTLEIGRISVLANAFFPTYWHRSYLVCC